jgi:hypothetical protein
LARKNVSDVAGLVGINETISIIDIGAAAIAETPVYKDLVTTGLGHLFAFDGDERHIEKLQKLYTCRYRFLSGQRI